MNSSNTGTTSVRRVLRKLFIPFAVAIVGIGAVTAAYAITGGDSLDAVKDATSRFRDVNVATSSGYARFADANGVACIDQPGVGAMGVHYVNGDLVGDAVLDPLRPEALVYQPDGAGRPHLVALEYIVFQDKWMAAHTTPPSLFGETFDLTPSPNRFGLPAFYSLHAWAWKHNPAGTFSMWNPAVHCTTWSATTP